MGMSDLELLRLIKNNKRVPKGYDEELVSLENRGLIRGLKTKYSSQTKERKLMLAICIPGQTEVTNLGERYIEDNEER